MSHGSAVADAYIWIRVGGHPELVILRPLDATRYGIDCFDRRGEAESLTEVERTVFHA